MLLLLKWVNQVVFTYLRTAYIYNAVTKASPFEIFTNLNFVFGQICPFCQCFQEHISYRTLQFYDRVLSSRVAS